MIALKDHLSNTYRRPFDELVQAANALRASEHIKRNSNPSLDLRPYQQKLANKEQKYNQAPRQFSLLEFLILDKLTTRGLTHRGVSEIDTIRIHYCPEDNEQHYMDARIAYDAMITTVQDLEFEVSWFQVSPLAKMKNGATLRPETIRIKDEVHLLNKHIAADDRYEIFHCMRQLYGTLSHLFANDSMIQNEMKQGELYFQQLSHKYGRTHMQPRKRIQVIPPRNPYPAEKTYVAIDVTHAEVHEVYEDAVVAQRALPILKQKNIDVIPFNTANKMYRFEF